MSNDDELALKIAGEMDQEALWEPTMYITEFARRLRAESAQEPVACKHEPFEGFCIHCGVRFSNGHALSAPESVTWQMCDAGIAAAGKGYMNHDKISAEDAEIIFLAMLAASKEPK